MRNLEQIENILILLSMAQVDSIDETTGDKTSRWTVPLIHHILRSLLHIKMLNLMFKKFVGILRLTNLFLLHTVNKEMKCSGVSKILQEIFLDTTWISLGFSDFRVVSRTISCSISEFLPHFIFFLEVHSRSFKAARALQHCMPEGLHYQWIYGLWVHVSFGMKIRPQVNIRKNITASDPH